MLDLYKPQRAICQRLYHAEWASPEEKSDDEMYANSVSTTLFGWQAGSVKILTLHSVVIIDDKRASAKVPMIWDGADVAAVVKCAIQEHENLLAKHPLWGTSKKSP